MKQLGYYDYLMLLGESHRTPFHLGPIMIYDPSTAPGGELTFEQVTEAVRRLLPRVPVFRRKIVKVPFGLDQAYWVEDADFDLEFHLRHLALPKPGDWRQFRTQVARLQSQPLDMSRPPWELTMIDGLDAIDGVPPGSFALSLKVHHAAIDGMAGVEMINVMHATSPDEQPQKVKDTWRPDRTPSPWKLLVGAYVHAFTRPVSAARLALANASPILRETPARRRQRASRAGSVPRTRFNERVTAHKVFDSTQFPVEEFRKIKASVPGATVNDVCIAWIAGGMIRYLNAKGEAPDRPLIAGCPISTRASNSPSMEGNQLASMRVSMHSDIADPIERLKAIHESTRLNKAAKAGVAAETLRAVSEAIPGALIGLAMRAMTALPGGSVPANTVITNTPGSKVPLYFCGARLVRMTGVTPVYDGMGLMHAVSSYVDDFLCQVTACREQLPDIEFYMQCLQDSLDELNKAVAAGHQPASRRKATARATDATPPAS